MTSDEEFAFSPTINSLLDSKTLNWIFVGGKGGVGKTTTACAIAKLLCERGKRVLLISTDPAHNISDALGQKVGDVPTAVKGQKNLDAMEISPEKGLKSLLPRGDSENHGLLGDLLAAIPGIDEAVSFAELMRQVRDMTHDVIVFDTAPTGHTLKFLGFPAVLEKGIAKLIELRNRFSGVMASIQAAFISGGDQAAPNGLPDALAQLESTKAVVEAVNEQFQNEALTAFVAVCIPEFLSVYETSRLFKALGEYKIACETLVVNQVLFPPKGSGCDKCLARVKMQRPYLEQINDMFDCSVVTVPLMDDEVRGLESIGRYSRYLCEPYNGE